ncbi:MAG: hypothetical protein ISS66_15485 [Desulfobacteraceae bacterium]|nr:hypothetical protein [Desulfobacteraceae bacterium]
MINDPIVQEVRNIRHQIEKECHQDPEKYYQHLKSLQEKLSERLVCRKPNPLPVAKQKTG